MNIILIFSFLWALGTIKFVLFWIYLWQLKDYHIGRFIDHFRTQKGKKLIFNWLLLVKLLLLLAILFTNDVFYALLALYVVQTLSFLIASARKRVKKPVFTSKTLFLAFVCLVVMMLYGYMAQQQSTLFGFMLALLLFDIFLPIVISVIVLLFQPFFVTARNRILEKARKKMEKFPNLIVIGITGSYGKTSTKEFLHTILSEKFNVLATPDHKNSEIGIAQTILQDLKSDHEIFIVEMGAYNKGGIDLLCGIVKPRIGLVTGVNEQHLAMFGSLDNLLSAEGGRELADHIPPAGLLVLNGDNKYCLDLYKKTDKPKKVYTVTKDKINSDIWTEEVMIEKNHISFVAMSCEKEMVHITVNVLGGHNVQNMLGAMLVARELDMTFEEIAQAAKNISQEQAGMTLKTGAHGINIIDSSYSANPDGVMADLDYLRTFKGKKVIIMPCLIELGSKSIQVHIDIGNKIAQVCDMAIITTKDKFEEIKNGAIINGMPVDKIIFCENQKEVFNIITTFCSQGDAVLLEGGRPKKLIKLLEKKQ